MGPTEAPGPKGAGVVALCTGKVTAGTPWKPHPPQDTDVQALLFLLSLPFFAFQQSLLLFQVSAVPVITVLIVLPQKHLPFLGEQSGVQSIGKNIDHKSFSTSRASVPGDV